jgi:hypothetical protein
LSCSCSCFSCSNLSHSSLFCCLLV